MSEATPPVAVHLGVHGPTARAVRGWCGDHRHAVADRDITVRTSWSALRTAVPGLDWRSDSGRARLRAHLATGTPTLFSSTAPLGAAVLPHGGALYPHADAGIDALAVALADVPWSVHLTVPSHADAITSMWVATVRHGHRTDLEGFWRSLDDPTWVPLVERLVAAAGADRVTVHDATGVRTAVEPADATSAVARSVLTTVAARLLGTPHDLPIADVPAAVGNHWSARQLTVALATLPHLRSQDERHALTKFVTGHVDDDGAPAAPLSAVQEAELLTRDAADLERIRDLVEVR